MDSTPASRAGDVGSIPTSPNLQIVIIVSVQRCPQAAIASLLTTTTKRHIVTICFRCLTAFYCISAFLFRYCCFCFHYVFYYFSRGILYPHLPPLNPLLRSARLVPQLVGRCSLFREQEDKNVKPSAGSSLYIVALRVLSSCSLSI